MLTRFFHNLQLKQDAWGLKEKYLANQNFMVQEGHLRYAYEAIILETSSVRIELFHLTPKDKSCYITNVMQVSEWGLDLSKSRSLKFNGQKCN